MLQETCFDTKKENFLTEEKEYVVLNFLSFQQSKQEKQKESELF